MSENLTSIERKVQPIAQMSDTVKICKENIDTALEQINKVTSSITEQEDIVEILIERKAMINSEFDVYIKSMARAIELIQYFEVDLAYFKDSFSISEKLKEAVKVAVEECDRYMEANIKKLLDVSSKKYIKRFRELLIVLEKTTGNNEFKKYLKYYIDVRRGTFKSRLGSSNSLDKQVDLSLSTIEQPVSSRISILAGSSSSTYERGSHQAIQIVQEIAQMIEEEMNFAMTIFECGGSNRNGIAGYSALSISVKVSEKLIQKLAQLLGQCEQELGKVLQEESGINTKPFIVMLDILETLYETMPKSYQELIKVQELPFKKAIQGILFKCYQFLFKVQKLSKQEDDDEDVPDYSCPKQRIILFIGTIFEVSSFPKAFKMIKFVNDQIKDELKRFKQSIQSIELDMQKFKKKHSLREQFAINNYGYLYSRLESSHVQSMFGLNQQEDIVGQLKQILDSHLEHFSLLVWKDSRSALKLLFTKTGTLSPDYLEISETICAAVDSALRKDFKKYQISSDIGVKVKQQLKEAMMMALVPLYERYLQHIKPENAYNVEDIEISIEKMLKI